MRGLDTNVLLRPFVEDEPAQTAAAKALFREAEAHGERFFVSCIALCEMCWALRGYGYARPDIVLAIDKLLATSLFEIQDRELVRRALAEYRDGRGDFADYLIGWQGRQALCKDTVTFDRKLRETPGFSLLATAEA